MGLDIFARLDRANRRCDHCHAKLVLASEVFGNGDRSTAYCPTADCSRSVWTRPVGVAA
jgi:hypothetical protein